MKVIISGSRGIKAKPGRELLELAIEDARSHGVEITEVVCGKGRAGIDKSAREWAAENSVPVSIYAADYEQLRASAGYIRNYDLVKSGDALIALTTGTTGTEHLIHIARSKGMPVFVIAVSFVSSLDA